MKLSRFVFIFTMLVTVLQTTSALAQVKPLPSWKDNPHSQRIISFVESVTDESGDDFVASKDRIAVFDNDGTLWSEQPAYFQLYFAVEQVQAMAKADPVLAAEFTKSDLFSAVLDNDFKAVMSQGEEGLLELVEMSHSGVTAAEFEASVNAWANSAKHPDTGRLFIEMVYQPMLEILDYLRANDFDVYIVSGGGMDFIRPWAERVYGIPKQNVIGSRLNSSYEYVDGVPVIKKNPKVAFIDDKEGKPVAIHEFIGKRPIMAFGNSDGDLQMLEWTSFNSLPNLPVYIQHTDAEREWAYDSESHIGRLKQGLIDAKKNDWLVVDMKNDWLNVYPPTKN